MEIAIPDNIKHLYADKKHPIVKIPNPILRLPCKPIEIFDENLNNFINDMIYWSYHGPGIGIAAPQLGRSERIILVDPEYGKPEIYINPEIIHQEEHMEIEEGCLSIPGVFGLVKRSRIVTIKALNREGNPVNKTYNGLGAVVVQHELDHLDGILFIDKAIPGTLYARDPDEMESKRKTRETELRNKNLGFISNPDEEISS